MKDQESGQQQQQPAVPLKRRSPWGVYLGLPLITLGIYYLVWAHKINKELKAFHPELPVRTSAPAWSFAIGFFIWPIINMYQFAKAIEDRQRAEGIPTTCSPGMAVGLCFVFWASILYIQQQYNTLISERTRDGGLDK